MDLPLTRLEAINYMLLSVGQQAVNSIDASGVGIVSQADMILQQVSREIQSIGLLCNSEEDYPLAIDVDGYINVPVNTLKVDASDSTDVVLRGTKLYDRENHTYVFEDTLECDIVLFLDFEELPQVVRNYILMRSTRLFQSKIVGNEAMYAFSAKDEQDAYIQLVAEQIENGDYNILNNSDIQSLNRRS